MRNYLTLGWGGGPQGLASGPPPPFSLCSKSAKNLGLGGGDFALFSKEAVHVSRSKFNVHLERSRDGIYSTRCVGAASRCLMGDVNGVVKDSGWKADGPVHALVSHAGR